MNQKAGTDETHPPIALLGRVPVRVRGTVTKGQKLVVSEVPGVAKAAVGGEDRDLIVGRALKDKYNDEEALLEAVLINH